MKSWIPCLLVFSMLTAFGPHLSAAPGTQAAQAAQAEQGMFPQADPRVEALNPALLAQVAGDREVYIVTDDRPRRSHSVFWYGLGGLVLTVVVVTLVLMNGPHRD